MRQTEAPFMADLATSDARRQQHGGPVDDGPPEQSLEDRRFWFGILPKPRQEEPCSCRVDGTPKEFCVDCLGTGMHAKRDPGDMRGGTKPPRRRQHADNPKDAHAAPEKQT